MYLQTSLTSIDKSPTLGCRVFDDSSLYSSSTSSAKPAVPPLSWDNRQYPTSVRRTTSDLLPDRWDFVEAISDYSKSTILPDQALQTYSSFLVAPVATPESLSEESSIGSKNSIARRARKLWRKEKMKKQRAVPADGQAAVLAKSGQNVMLPGYENSDPCAESDIIEMTEGSSVYCLSPLSSVRASQTAVSSRLQLKREIMRLYQRAAADVEISDGSPRCTSRQLHSVQTGSRSATTSSPSQPSSTSQCNAHFTFPTENLSPVFGASHYRTSSESSNAESSPVPRPATANGNSPFRLQTERPNRNTSF